MRFFVLVACLFLGSFSFAQTTTKYDRIKELYDTGSSVTLAEVNGVWNGRCFLGTERDHARLATFGMPEVSDDSAGPEFESEKYRILIFDSYGISANRQDAIEGYRTQKIAPVEAAGGVELTFDGIQYGVRKNGPYLMVFNITEDMHCYFYQPVK